MEEFHEFSSNGDRESAVRCIHSLKGILGTLGAKELQEKARIIEAGLQHDTHGLEGLLNDLDFDLALLFAAIDGISLEESKVADNMALDSIQAINFAEVDTLVKQARKQLEQFDAEVDNTMIEIRHCLKEHRRLLQGLQAVEACLQGYDYEQGLAEFNRWDNVYLKLYLKKSHELQDKAF